MDDDRRPRRRRVIRVPDLSGMIHTIVAPEWYDDDLLCQIREQMARYEAAKPGDDEPPAITLNEVGL